MSRTIASKKAKGVPGIKKTEIWPTEIGTFNLQICKTDNPIDKRGHIIHNFEWFNVIKSSKKITVYQRTGRSFRSTKQSSRQTNKTYFSRSLEETISQEWKQRKIVINIFKQDNKKPGSLAAVEEFS